MPPALPPRDRAHVTDETSGSTPLRTTTPVPDGHVGDGALRAEIDLLRRTVDRLGDELTGLQQAMRSRADIDQAKGAIRAVTGLSGDEAFTLLASRSQNTNRKLNAVALDVLAAVDVPDSAAGVLAALHLPDPRPQAPATPPADGAGWRPRRRWDQLATAVTDRDQLLALADLAEHLAGAPDRSVVVDVLLRDGADALGAFAAGLATPAGDGTATVELEGVALAEDAPATVRLDAEHPAAECLRQGRTLVLSRADLALRYPGHQRPERLRGLAVLPVGLQTSGPAAWTLMFEHPVPGDRGSRAMLDRAARLASAALARAR